MFALKFAKLLGRKLSRVEKALILISLRATAFVIGIIFVNNNKDETCARRYDSNWIVQLDKIDRRQLAYN